MASDKMEQAKRAYRVGDKSGARALLLEITEEDPDNKAVWAWLSRVAIDDDELRVCLENILYFDPDNEKVREKLDELGGPLQDTEEDEDEENYEDLFEQSLEDDYEDDEDEEDGEDPEFDIQDIDDDLLDDEDDYDDEEEEDGEIEDDYDVDDDYDVEEDEGLNVDPFFIIPSAILATRIPGKSEAYPAWVMPSVMLLVLFNVVALAMLLMNL